MTNRPTPTQWSEYKLSKNLCVTHLPLSFHARLFPFQVLEGQTHRGKKCNIPST